MHIYTLENLPTGYVANDCAIYHAATKNTQSINASDTPADIHLAACLIMQSVNNGNTNCHDCTNCTNCHGCHNCENCTDCTDCHSCYNCHSCENCHNCRDCHDCTNCTGCNDCHGCHGCANCNDCVNCTDCNDCVNHTDQQPDYGATPQADLPERLQALMQSAGLALQAAIYQINPATYPEQQSDPHSNLTDTSIILAVAGDGEAYAPALFDYLEATAHYYGYAVTGSYIGAVIIEKKSE